MAIITETVNDDQLYDSNQIPRLKGFNEALDYYKKAIRRKRFKTSYIPLRKDGLFSDWYWLDMLENNIEIRAGTFSTITYKPDGSIVVDLKDCYGAKFVGCVIKGLLGVDLVYERDGVMFAGEYIFEPNKPFLVCDGRLLRDRVGVVLQPGNRPLPKWQKHYNQILRWRKDYASMKKSMFEGWEGKYVSFEKFDEILFSNPEERVKYKPPEDSSPLIEHMFYELRRLPKRGYWFEVISQQKAELLASKGLAWPLEEQ